MNHVVQSFPDIAEAWFRDRSIANAVELSRRIDAIASELTLLTQSFPQKTTNPVTLSKNALIVAKNPALAEQTKAEFLHAATDIKGWRDSVCAKLGVQLEQYTEVDDMINILRQFNPHKVAFPDLQKYTDCHAKLLRQFRGSISKLVEAKARLVSDQQLSPEDVEFIRERLNGFYFVCINKKIKELLS